MNFEKCLIDTIIWVLYFRGEKDVEDKVRSIILEDRAATTEIIVLEILRGARSQKEYDQLKGDLKALHLLRLNQAIWERSYHMGFKLRKAGINVPLTDILIAVIASYYQCSLIHRDKHFPLMTKLVALRQERV